MIKKLLLFMTLLFSLSFVNAGSFIFDQTQVLNDFNTADLGNVQLIDLVGSLNTESIGSQGGDLELEYASLQNDVYFYLDNGDINTTLNITYFFGGESGAITQELTLEETGVYYFQIKPDFEGESGSVLIQAPDSFVSVVRIVHESDKGLSSVFEIFVNAVAEIIDINVSAWRLMFYLFLFAVVVGVFYAMFKGFFRFLEFADEISAKRKGQVKKRGE